MRVTRSREAVLTTTILGAAVARLVAPISIAIGLLLLVAGGMFAAHTWSRQLGFAQQDDVANRQLDLYAASLESELGKHGYLPSLLEADPDIVALFEHSDAPLRSGLRDAANRRLASVNVRASSIAIFVIGANGKLLAASDWGSTRPSVSQQLTTQPFFAPVVQGERTQFFAANATSGATEYFFAEPVQRSGRFVGTIGVKISLEPLEATWVDLGVRSDSEKLLVVDENGVVILSSVPAFKFRTLSLLSVERRITLEAVGAYPANALQPLGLLTMSEIARGAKMVRVPATERTNEMHYVAQERPMAQLGWRLIILSDPADVWRNAIYAALGGGAASAFMGLLSLYLLQRQRAMTQLSLARNALQSANDLLEVKVDQRTKELRLSNDKLVNEIEERHRAEDELVQAGKMAALGQMSVGISHEINQPLTALRALAKNTVALLRQGRNDDAAANLTTIGDVTERLGRITAQLKSFARKSTAVNRSVSLVIAIEHMQILLEHRTREEQVELRVDVPDDRPVVCDINRLEQVLVNLATNALDAMRHSPTKVLAISAVVREARMRVRVADTGTGAPDNVLSHLTEPFFTTKPPGEGLGLGLTISANIVRELGSVLQVTRGEIGLIFEFDLKLSREKGEAAHV